VRNISTFPFVLPLRERPNVDAIKRAPREPEAVKLPGV
jgi:hypothetical protein